MDSFRPRDQATSPRTGRNHVALVLVSLLLSATPTPAAEIPADAVITTLDNGCLQIAGRIIVDRIARTVTVPAVVNQQRGLVEYLLVHNTGKKHEAVFTTSARPQHVHLACLLVGAPDGVAPSVADETAQPVMVTVAWQGHGPEVRVTAELLLLPAAHDGEPLAGATITPARWSYVGSRFSTDGFTAEQQGSCIALQPDPAALMTAPGLAGEFIPNSTRLPAIGSPVSIILTFAAAVPTAAQEHL